MDQARFIVVGSDLVFSVQSCHFETLLLIILKIWYRYNRCKSSSRCK